MRSSLILMHFAVVISMFAADPQLVVNSKLQALQVNTPLSITVPDSINLPGIAQLLTRNCRVQGAAVWVELRCQHYHCRPFFVELSYATAAEAKLAAQLLAKDLPSETERRPVILHAGRSTSLVLLRRGVKITLPVRALQSGSIGQVVRVRDSDKKIYLAVVRSANRVEAR